MNNISTLDHGLRLMKEDNGMEFKYLETVLAVAEFLSFSKAAEIIPCSQASVSRQVSDVEKELGYPIFTRTRKNGIISITEQGRQALPLIEQIVSQYRNLFDEEPEAKQFNYRLGLSAGIFNYRAKYNLVSHIFASYPEINLQLEDIDRKNWMHALTSGQVDAMLIHDVIDHSPDAPPTTFPCQSGLSFTFLRERCPYIVFPKNHPMASRECVQLEELAQETFLFNHDLNKVGERSRDALVNGFHAHHRFTEQNRNGFRQCPRHFHCVERLDLSDLSVQDVVLHK